MIIVKKISHDESDAISIAIQHVDNIAGAVEAVSSVAAKLGFSNTMSCMMATAVSELATNICRYADNGFISIKIINNKDQHGIEIIAEDEGPGIVNIELALTDNFSTSGSLGVGLPGTKRMMDEFKIETKIAKGTRVTIRKWLSE